jgi:hypothetical protein
MPRRVDTSRAEDRRAAVVSTGGAFSGHPDVLL